MQEIAIHTVTQYSRMWNSGGSPLPRLLLALLLRPACKCEQTLTSACHNHNLGVAEKQGFTKKITGIEKWSTSLHRRLKCTRKSDRNTVNHDLFKLIKSSSYVCAVLWYGCKQWEEFECSTQTGRSLQAVYQNLLLSSIHTPMKLTDSEFQPNTQHLGEDFGPQTNDWHHNERLSVKCIVMYSCLENSKPHGRMIACPREPMQVSKPENLANGHINPNFEL